MKPGALKPCLHIALALCLAMPPAALAAPPITSAPLNWVKPPEKTNHRPTAGTIQATTPPTVSKTPPPPSKSAGNGNGYDYAKPTTTPPALAPIRRDPSAGQQADLAAGQPKKLPRYYAMCLFLDPMHDSKTGSETIKKMVDDAAKCDVALVVFPFTMKQGYPTSAGAFNSAQTKMCNIPEAKIAPKASASGCVAPANMADEMCGMPGGVAGCAEMQSKEESTLSAGDKKKQRDKMKASGHGGGDAKGGVAASIEDAGACGADLVSHEALGHSQMAVPNGSSHGMGIGNEGEDGGGGGGGWTAAGCSALFANAYENDRGWTYDPSRRNYYTKSEDESVWKDMNEAKPIFGVPPLVASGSPAPPPTATGDGQKRLGIVDGKPKTPTDLIASVRSSQSTTAIDGAPPGLSHRQKPGSNSISSGGGSGLASSDDPSRFLGRTPASELTGAMGGTSTIYFKDGAKERPVGLASGGPVVESTSLLANETPPEPQSAPDSPATRASGNFSGPSGKTIVFVDSPKQFSSGGTPPSSGASPTTLEPSSTRDNEIASAEFSNSGGSPNVFQLQDAPGKPLGDSTDAAEAETTDPTTPTTRKPASPRPRTKQSGRSAPALQDIYNSPQDLVL